MQAFTEKIKPHLLPALALLFATIAVYGQTIGFDFLSNWDDYQYITSNPDIRGFSARNLAHIFSTSYVGNYAPIHLLSYLFDYQLAGLNPAWFHGMNVLFHLANGLLFYLLVHRITGKPLWALASGAIFLLHPVQVESVAWVTERKNVLSMFFSLLSFLSYLSYRKGSAERRHLAYVCALVFLVLALFTKSIAVVMPVAFLLYDYFLAGEKGGKGILVDKIPFIVAAAVASAVTMVTQSAEMGGGSVDLFGGDLHAKILTMLTVLTRYLQLLFWPTNASLNSVYILFVKERIDGEVILALLLVLALVVSGIYLLRRERRLFFGFALFFLGLLPVSQIVPLATLMNDRYLYFPMLGAAFLAGGVLSRLSDRFSLQKVNPAHVLVCLLILPCLLVSYQRCGVWRNAISLWSDVVQKYPTLRDQRAALAAAYVYDDQKGKALQTYEEVFALKRPFNDPTAEQKAYIEAARLYLEGGSPAKALPLLATLNGKYPDQPRGYLLLGDYYSRSGNLAEAEKAYRKALQVKPGYGNALAALAEICLKTGRVDEARGIYLESTKAGDSPELEYNLARVEALARDNEKALQHLDQALKLGFRNVDALTGNPELAPLRQTPGFGTLMASYFPSNK